jgi:hypothetical protein
VLQQLPRAAGSHLAASAAVGDAAPQRLTGDSGRQGRQAYARCVLWLLSVCVSPLRVGWHSCDTIGEIGDEVAAAAGTVCIKELAGARRELQQEQARRAQLMWQQKEAEARLRSTDLAVPTLVHKSGLLQQQQQQQQQQQLEVDSSGLEVDSSQPVSDDLGSGLAAAGSDSSGGNGVDGLARSSIADDDATYGREGTVALDFTAEAAARKVEDLHHRIRWLREEERRSLQVSAAHQSSGSYRSPYFLCSWVKNRHLLLPLLTLLHVRVALSGRMQAQLRNAKKATDAAVRGEDRLSLRQLHAGGARTRHGMGTRKTNRPSFSAEARLGTPLLSPISVSAASPFA